MDLQEFLICVTEDNNSIRKLLSTLLNKSGYNTIEFATGRSTIDWALEHNPICMIVDILLPDISGTEILKAIRKKPDGEQISVIAVTGFAKPTDRERFLNLGFDDYISKPVDIMNFSGQVKSTIERKAVC